MRISRNALAMNNNIFQQKALYIQISIILLLWVLIIIYAIFAPDITWDKKLTLGTFLSIPAAVIIIGQLAISAHIARATYIKDYALKFRTNTELSESFHYLVYRYGNGFYDIFKKEEKSDKDIAMLEEAQKDVSMDLRFYDPDNAIGAAQERRLDNLLGFFDAVGYDLRRGLVNIKDVSGVFGYHLDHFIQRKPVQDYLLKIEKEWGTKKSFHKNYKAPTPFQYLRTMLRKYENYRKYEFARDAEREEKDI